MIEILLLFILVLVFYNSKLWEKGEWQVNKTKWLYYWKSK